MRSYQRTLSNLAIVVIIICVLMVFLDFGAAWSVRKYLREAIYGLNSPNGFVEYECARTLEKCSRRTAFIFLNFNGSFFKKKVLPELLTAVKAEKDKEIKALMEEAINNIKSM